MSSDRVGARRLGQPAPAGSVRARGDRHGDASPLRRPGGTWTPQAGTSETLLALDVHGRFKGIKDSASGLRERGRAGMEPYREVATVYQER